METIHTATNAAAATAQEIFVNEIVIMRERGGMEESNFRVNSLLGMDEALYASGDIVPVSGLARLIPDPAL